MKAMRTLGVAMLALLFMEEGHAQTALPSPQEPWQPDPNDRYAVYYPLVVACYEGSMKACELNRVERSNPHGLVFGPVRPDVRRPGEPPRDQAFGPQLC